MSAWAKLMNRFDRYVRAMPSAMSAVTRPISTPRTKIPRGTPKKTCWNRTIPPASRYGIARLTSTRLGFGVVIEL